MKISVDGEVYEFDTNRILNTEAIALQKVTGMTVAEWGKACDAGDAYALTAMVWLVWRRNGRDVPFDDVEFDLNSLEAKDDEVPDPGTPTPAADPEGAPAA